MTGLYIFGGLIVVGIVAFIFFKIKWSRADRAETRTREKSIEDDRIEDKRIKDKRIKEEDKKNTQI